MSDCSGRVESVIDIDGIPYTYTTSIVILRPSIPANYDLLPLLGSSNNTSFIKDLTPISFPGRGTIQPRIPYKD